MGLYFNEVACLLLVCTLLYTNNAIEVERSGLNVEEDVSDANMHAFFKKRL